MSFNFLRLSHIFLWLFLLNPARLMNGNKKRLSHVNDSIEILDTLIDRYKSNNALCAHDQELYAVTLIDFKWMTQGLLHQDLDISQDLKNYIDVCTIWAEVMILEPYLLHEILDADLSASNVLGNFEDDKRLSLAWWYSLKEYGQEFQKKLVQKTQEFIHALIGKVSDMVASLNFVTI